MLVILRENVDNLGHTGDVVKVSQGYARNFLLPRNLVVAADEKNIAVIEHHKRLSAPIKTLGVHPVTVKLEADVHATLKVWVVKEES